MCIDLILTALAHCIRPLTDLIDFARGDPKMHCGSVRSVGSVVTFQAATDPSANQIALCESNSTEGVSPLSQTRLPLSVDGRMQWASYVRDFGFKRTKSTKVCQESGICVDMSPKV